VDGFSEAAHDSDTAPPPSIEVVDGDDGLEFQHVTLNAAEGDKLLVEDLNLTVTRGMRLLVIGPGEMAKMAFFRATADLWNHGSGRIVRPSQSCLCFLPERPYIPPGTLREILASPECATAPTDEKIHDVLHGLSLGDTLTRIGGLDVERDWDDILSLGQLQRFAIARVLLVAPKFAVLDRIETTVEAERMSDVLGMFDGAGITYVTIGRSDSDLPHYDAVLELTGIGPWTLHAARVERPVQDEPNQPA
jgi:putative ATP-binding cassette transporter